MKIVNPYFLDELLSPLTGLADDDGAVEHYRHIELNSEDQYKSVIKDTLIEPFNNLDEERKQKSKLALSYYLTKQKCNFERVFNSCLPPFHPPEDARDFFIWLWESLFPGESYIVSDSETYKVVPNIYEPNRPTRAKK